MFFLQIHIRLQNDLRVPLGTLFCSEDGQHPGEARRACGRGRSGGAAACRCPGPCPSQTPEVRPLPCAVTLGTPLADPPVRGLCMDVGATARLVGPPGILKVTVASLDFPHRRGLQSLVPLLGEGARCLPTSPHPPPWCCCCRTNISKPLLLGEHSLLIQSGCSCSAGSQMPALGLGTHWLGHRLISCIRNRRFGC